MADEKAELVLCEYTTEDTKLEIVCSGIVRPIDPAHLRLDVVWLRVQHDGATANETGLSIYKGEAISAEVPTNLLVKRGDGRYQIRNRHELGDLAQEEWAALKDRARRRFVSPIDVDMDVDGSMGLFGVKAIGTAKLSARFWLNPALVDGLDTIADNDWLLRADGSAQIDFSYQDAAMHSLELTGRILVTLQLNKSSLADLVDVNFGFDLPDLPGFDLRLPTLKMPDFQFPSMEIDFPDLPSAFFSLSLPPIIDKLSFKWKPPPKLRVTLTDGSLAIQTTQAGQGDLAIDSNSLANVTGVELKHADDKFEFKAQLSLTTQPTSVPDKTFDMASLPFVVSLSGNTLIPTFSDLDLGGGNVLANVNLGIEFTSQKIVVSARDDPAVFITLCAAVVITYDLGTKKTHTKFTDLAIIEPYSIALIRAGGDAVGELIRLVAAIPLSSAKIPNVDPAGVLRLLDRLGRLLVSAARWLARQAGKAAGLLAGLVESVFEALMQLVRKLAEFGDDAISHIAIEVRLDPKTYRLRQIVIMPVADEATLDRRIILSALGFDFTLDAKLRPALVIDLGPESWTGLVIQPNHGSQSVLATDLWLDKETSPQQAMGTTDRAGEASDGKRLITVKAIPSTEANTKIHDLVIAAVQHGRPKFFQTFSANTEGERFDGALQFDGMAAVTMREVGTLRDAAIRFKSLDRDEVYPKGATPVLDLSLEAPDLKDRVLSLLTKAEVPAQGAGNDFIGKLKQKVEITSTKYEMGENFSFVLALGVRVHIDQDFAPETNLKIAVSLRDLSMKVTGGDRIGIIGAGDMVYHPLGLDLTVTRKDQAAAPDTKYEQFYLDLSHGGESFGLGKEAKALLAYGKVSTSGKGLQFEVPTFSVGRAGFDLKAKILPEPVKLGGVDVPFRFTSGQVSIKGSQFGGGSIAGAGQLPQALVGEANASIALQLGAGQGGGVIVKGATGRLDKSGDPIRCTSTRFELTITELGFDYVLDGSYHFYFQLTGSAVFKPGGSEYASGLLKNFKDITIKLDKAPLAGDGRVLMRSISFQVKVDPPKKMSFFDIFDFELRGFGFHPSSPKFDGDPAMSISGQVKFMQGGDKISPNFEFHSLWIAAPKAGSAKPRIRFDGLTVGLRTGAVNVEGTAIAVDGSMPDLYRPGVLPADVTAEGFLASGRLDIDGWASMSAAMGFLELRKKNSPSRPRHSFFLYGQIEKLAEPIDTPVGRIYLREFGFGFGYRYTLAGIAQADTAKTPQELVKVLDHVSKYQGSLNTFEAWEPTYDDSSLTLALRGLFALSAVEGSSYDAKKEADLPNPLLFDIVVAFRTDFTFLINLRAWVSVNYNDWVTASLNESWKSQPTMRGYLYFSVPRKEFLGRFISDGKGYVGQHPKLPSPLVDAIRKTQFSAMLYIRPGLFHAELGWPYELGVEFGKPGDTFYLKLNGGLIHRIEDGSVLTGVAFKALGSVYLEGRVGSSRLGAAAVARANFSIEARVLSYLSLKDAGDSFYYGYMRIDVSVGVSVEVWLSFKIFSKRITLSASFPLSLAVSIALEAVIGPQLLGGRAQVSIGVRAFGRSLSVSIGLSFNNDKLAIARAKVARFMELGLSAPIPDKSQHGQHIETNPKPAAPRSELASHGDNVVEQDVGSAPLAPTEDEEDRTYDGRPIGPTDFWAMLFPTRAPTDIKKEYNVAGTEWYVIQLVPRDHTDLGCALRQIRDAAFIRREAERATFYASPKNHDLPGGFGAPGHRLEINPKVSETQENMSLPFMGRLMPGAATEEISLGTASRHVFGMSLDETVAEGDGETLHLGHLLQSLFLGASKGDGTYDGDYSEPLVRRIDSGQIALDPDMKMAASQLARIGRNRSNLADQAKREAEIDETRSAVLSALAETAHAIAAAGPDGNKWASRLPEIDARDFGLTFLINRPAIKALFEDDDPYLAPPAARFTVTKSDVASGEAGTVALYNHPDRMFRAAQPKLTPTHVREPQGIKLNWDLEPAWGSSIGVYDDPEFHLKHYRIRRVIRGVPGREYRADFLVKAGSPIKQESVNGEFKVSFLRPDFQFIDDLRKQERATGSTTEDIPDVLRLLLVGQATDEEWGAKQLDIEAGQVGNIEVLYEIVPIDNAGTSDFGKVHVVGGFKLIQTLPISPREVTLQLAYRGMPTSVMPTANAQPITLANGEPSLRLLMNPAVALGPNGEEKTVLWPDGSKEQIYLLRIFDQRIAPSGSYGSDAVDEARRRPDQDAITRLRKESVKEFLLSAKRLPDTDMDKATLVAERQSPADDTFDTRCYQLSLHDLPPAGPNGGSVPLGKPIDIKQLLDAIDASNTPNPDRKGHRLFLATVESKLDGKKVLVEVTRRGEWKTVAFNLAIARHKSETAKTEDLAAISSVVEVLEQPVHYEFAPLQREDMAIESGRLIVIQPGITARLQSLTALKDDAQIFVGVRDGARRSATRLEWNAYPASLKLAESAAGVQHNMVGGFDVFCVDPDSLPGRDEPTGEVEALARPMGRVALLPREMDGLEPAGFGDFGRIESAYPSDTLRLKYSGNVAGASGPRKAGWYSAAETAAVFPEPSIRRSLMSEPDEGSIAALFAGGRPDAIRVSIPAWRDLKLADQILKGWQIGESVHPTSWGEFAAAWPDKQSAGAWEVTFSSKDGFTVPLLRQLLQSLVLTQISAEEAKPAERRVLQRRVGEPGYLSSVNLIVESLRKNAQNQMVVVASEQHSFDLIPALHPILGDALAFLQYDAQSGALATAAGKIYRRYALAPDANPEVTATEFEAYADGAPAERDPHGSGALRTLGLAAGFRLFDTEIGDYVRFGGSNDDLALRIQDAFTRALARYVDDGRRDNGQPFVDILTQPWGNVRLAWFDGGQRRPTGLDDVRRLEDEMLAVVQIALRPRPDRLIPANSPDDYAGQVVRYFALTTDDRLPIAEGSWKIALAPQTPAVARFDVLTVGRGIGAQKPARLTQDVPLIDVYEPRPHRPMTTQDSGSRVIAIVRAVIVTSEVEKAFLTSELIVTPPGVDYGHAWVEIVQPSVLDALTSDGVLSEELAFGKFENLSGLDWGEALFRPSSDGKTAAPCEALDRLAHYVGRRFARLTIPVVQSGEPSNAEKENATRQRGELADRIVRFWSRFVEHCAPAWGRRVETRQPDGTQGEAIYISLGTVADPGQWRRAPGQSGTISVTMVDTERRGARRKFAVRPFGRYEAWSKAAPDKLANTNMRFTHTVPDGLAGAFKGLDQDAIGSTHFIDATLPRTEPLEKPVILSSVMHRPERDRPGRMELVVAHGTDMVLAQANRRNAALLAPLDISVGYWREFAQMSWLVAFKDRYKLKLDAMSSFGDLDQRLKMEQLKVTREVAEQRLVDVRQRVPDAWLGSTMISATPLPYFFRAHALVHSAAGIVVSEQAVATFEEGFSGLAWPFTADGYADRELSASHYYSVSRRPKSANPNEREEVTVITFNVAAVRFIDCIFTDQAELWFGESGNLWKDGLKRVAHLPEPSVSYRIAVETPLTVVSGNGGGVHDEVLARTQEIDVLPNPPSDDPERLNSNTKQLLYLLQQSGPRFTPRIALDEQGQPLQPSPTYGANPTLGPDEYTWRLPVLVQLTSEPNALERTLDQARSTLLSAVLAHIPAPRPNTAPAIAGMHDVSIKWTVAPSKDHWGAVATALLRVGDCPEAADLATSLAASLPSTGNVRITLSPTAVTDHDVRAAFRDIIGSDPDYGDISLLVLRRPPTDAELAAFEIALPDNDDAAATFKRSVFTLAEEQLFGAGRRPAVAALKGADAPITATFSRRTGV